MRICCFVQTEDIDLNDTLYVNVHEQRTWAKSVLVSLTGVHRF